MKSIINKTSTGRIETIQTGSFDGWHDDFDIVIAKNMWQLKKIPEGLWEIEYTYEATKNYDPYMFGYGQRHFRLIGWSELK